MMQNTAELSPSRADKNLSLYSAMSKKIAIVIERADVSLGGAERSVFELATAISRLGPEVYILAARGQTDAGNVHILCPSPPGKRACYFAFAKALRKQLSKNHYDIIHSVLPFEFADVYQPRGGTYAESILRNAASYRNRFSESFKRSTAFTNYRRTILVRAERKLCQQANGPVIAALSQYVVDQLKRHYGTDPRRIVLIPNGIETKIRIEPAATKHLRTRILTQLDLKEADKLVLFLFAANNFRLKGLTVLIEAMHLATTFHAGERDSFLVVAGSGRTHKYHDLANRLDVGGRILFLGPTSDIQTLLSVIDVAVLPTFYDPSSRFILEAIAAGKPVITTTFNGATDLFTNERHGKILNAPEDVGALADAVSYFTNAENIQKASQAIAADNLKEKISINRVAGQLISVYESILQRKDQK